MKQDVISEAKIKESSDNMGLNLSKPRFLAAQIRWRRYGTKKASLAVQFVVQGDSID